MTLQEASNRLLFQLYHWYEKNEAANIADLVMEHITGWRRIDRIVNRTVRLSAPQQEMLERYTEQLSILKPVQYVLNEAWFYDMKFYVDERVLIPRQETEELVQWILDDFPQKNSAITLIDIGTGSGCIPITIKKTRPAVTVSACDISSEALQVAALNAALHQTDLQLLQLDFLNESEWSMLPSPDVLVSNPPYIGLHEKEEMHANVVMHEPHSALFVPDEDALVFYRSIAAFGKMKLKPQGRVYVEVNERLARQTAVLFHEAGYSDVEIRKDMQGKERMVRSISD